MKENRKIHKSCTQAFKDAIFYRKSDLGESRTELFDNEGSRCVLLVNKFNILGAGEMIRMAML